MKDKKLQVFVSSTYTDLKEERQAAVETILSSGHIPAGMELFSAGDESQLSVIKRWIDESDVYLLILGGRYGSIEPKSGKSYTQLEYEYAVEQKKPLFAVVISEEALEKKVKSEGTAVIERENNKLLREFRAMVTSNLVKFWEDKKDIKIAIHKTISDFSYRKELLGWIRGDNSVNTGALAEELARLAKENAELRDKLSNVQTADTALYANLSYKELEKLLVNGITVDDQHYNLFDFLMDVSYKLIGGYEPMEGDDNSSLFELEILKVVKSRYVTQSQSTIYTFTADGHNFYLKAKAYALDKSEQA
jgi:hypothetical protein